MNYIIDNFIDLSGLGNLSEVNIELLKRSWLVNSVGFSELLDIDAKFGGWLQDSMVRNLVFDVDGVVEDAQAIPRGFPAWGDLAQHIARYHVELYMNYQGYSRPPRSQ